MFGFGKRVGNMQFFFLFFSLLLVSQGHGFSWTYTSEFLLTGKGDVNLPLMDQTPVLFFLFQKRKIEERKNAH